MLLWLVQKRAITPHNPVWDKSEREDGPSLGPTRGGGETTLTVVSPGPGRLHGPGLARRADMALPVFGSAERTARLRTSAATELTISAIRRAAPRAKGRRGCSG